MLIIEKEWTPARVQGATSLGINIRFLLEKLFDIRTLENNPPLSCGNCLAWSGGCRRGKIGKLAMDLPCELYMERVGATAFRDCAKVFG